MRLGPGLSFSWRRAFGVSGLLGRFARTTGIPTSESGRQRKVGRLFLNLFRFGPRKRERG